MQEALEKLVKEALNLPILNIAKLDRLKKKYSFEHKISTAPNYKVLEAYQSLLKQGSIAKSAHLENLLRKRKIRTLSGVAPVAALTKPFPCPGRCTFCPESKLAPKSYHPEEPAVMRAIRNEYDPFRQVSSRLTILERNGHNIEKIELIIVGGTFSSYPKKYQTEFIKRCFDAMNGEDAPDLPEAQKINETARSRCVAMSFETRPDYISEEELRRFRDLGCTKVEIGLQSTFDDILDKVKRGHNTDCVKQTIRKLKDAGFKINLHTMPNLPGSTPEKDVQMYQEIFNNPDYQPDHLKIYPCMVVEGTELFEEWKRGQYQPYDEKQLMEVILQIKKIIPEYVRLVRLTRDIPTKYLKGTTKTVNFRQYAHTEMQRRGMRCRCIRCREIQDIEINPKHLKFRKLEFPSSKGKEYFLSYNLDQEDKICSLLRLRIPSQIYSGERHFIPELQDCAIIRELHTYGKLIPLKSKQSGASQHIGMGKKLVQEAETLARKEGLRKIAVIAGVGVREYYKKLGYELQGTYMVKSL